MERSERQPEKHEQSERWQMKGEDESEGSEGRVKRKKLGEGKGNQKEILAKNTKGFVKMVHLAGIWYTFYHGKSPLNHDFGEYVLLFPSILCK